MSVFLLQFKLAFNQRSKKELWLWGIAFGLLISIGVFLLVFNHLYQDRFYQGIYIKDVEVGGLTKSQAKQKLQPYLSAYPSQAEVILSIYQPVGEDFQIISTEPVPISSLILATNVESAINQAYKVGRQGNLLAQAIKIASLLNQPETIELDYPINTPLIEQLVEKFGEQVNMPGEKPQSVLKESNNPYSIQIFSGEDGYQLMVEESVETISSKLHQLVNTRKDLRESLPAQLELEAVGKVIPLKLNEQQLEEAKARAAKFVSKSVIFSPNVDDVDKESQVLFSNSAKRINDVVLVELLDISKESDGLNHDQVIELVSSWAEEIDQEPIDAVFDYNPQTMRAIAFSPHQPGMKIDQQMLIESIVEVIKEIEKFQGDDLNEQSENKQLFEKEMMIKHAEPNITLAQTNNLGINELIGFGESYYKGSISPRMHNIVVASSYLNTTIVKPGETFSFNRVVGKVDGTTGYQQAYVIRSGSTLMEFGGGVCQVSTTLFRAMLDAGVDIVKRLPHSYRVSYYELNNQPGFDATVYSGEVDLRFINDTPGHLLIVAEADSAQAYMTVKIYGTSDGRYSEINNYKQWGYTAPPPLQEIPDPSLTPGERKRVENAIPGLKTSFDWTVYDKSGKVMRQKTFYSNYQAWGMKYLVGI